MFTEFSREHVQRTSIRVAAATPIQFRSIYVGDMIPRVKKASIEMLIDRNVTIQQDLRISLRLRGKLRRSSGQHPKLCEFYLPLRAPSIE